MNEAEALLRELDGTLSADGILELGDAVRRQPELAVKRRRWHLIAADLGMAKTISFGPMFSDRVLARLREARLSGEAAVYVHLRWMFARVAMAGVFLALVLGVYNVTGGPEFSGNVVETLFGLPAPGLESAVMLADS
ncbi:MAG: hypothetical protein E4H28_06425 [Gemmatimonadales bacterium]|nr:MAG: hypothetical protein E4H28_06425 [Gemmatimonadales bacterium]